MMKAKQANKKLVFPPRYLSASCWIRSMVNSDAEMTIIAQNRHVFIATYKTQTYDLSDSNQWTITESGFLSPFYLIVIRQFSEPIWTKKLVLKVFWKFGSCFMLDVYSYHLAKTLMAKLYTKFLKKNTDYADCEKTIHYRYGKILQKTGCKDYAFFQRNSVICVFPMNHLPVSCANNWSIKQVQIRKSGKTYNFLPTLQPRHPSHHQVQREQNTRTLSCIMQICCHFVDICNHTSYLML